MSGQNRLLGRSDGGVGRENRGDGRHTKPTTQYSSALDSSVPIPDIRVTMAEDEIQKILRESLSLDAQKTNSKFPLRPGYGTRGQQVTLYANCFEVISDPKITFYRYHVAVLPVAKGRRLRQIINLLLELPYYREHRHDIVTDFKSTLISSREIGPLDAGRVSIQYRGEGHDEPQAGAQIYQLNIGGTETFPISDYLGYLRSTSLSTSYSDKLPVLQALNILLGHFAKSSPAIIDVGSSKSFLRDQPSRDLTAGLLALRGFFSSVRIATCRVLANINVIHGAFYEHLPLDQLIQKYQLGHESDSGKLQDFLRGVRVQLIHLPEKINEAGEPIIRTRTISGLANINDGSNLKFRPRVHKFGAGAKEVEFFLNDTTLISSSSMSKQDEESCKKNDDYEARAASSQRRDIEGPIGGMYISVYDYFDHVHGHSISYVDLPIVNVGDQNNPIYLPAEVCHVLPGQISGSELNPTQTKEMMNFAVREPTANFKSITQDGPSVVGLLAQSNPQLARFGITVDKNLITVPGRLLPPPQVIYRKNMSLSVQGGSWNMRGAKLNTGANLQQWTYLMISKSEKANESTQKLLRSIVTKFHAALQAAGITVAPPFTNSGQAILDINVETTLMNIANDKRKINLVLMILPSEEKPLYSRIKRAGDLKFGLHTVCVTSNKFVVEKGQLAFFANVALKINLKLGGINQTVNNNRLGIISQDTTMVVGIDVTHPSPDSNPFAPSVAGMVASIDKWLSQWPADLRVQERRKEMVSELDSMLKSRLEVWKSRGHHNFFPENILVYRDGISEGQYTTVLDAELPLLRKACSEVYSPTGQALPRITIIVVGKRHHIRFLPGNTAAADKSGNCKNGTVVDRGVTEAYDWDFYMQAHSAIKGTARPAHYFVVHDEIFCKLNVTSPFKNRADMLEDLTHSMCYLFGRATKAVSISPPAYYADLLCDRARCYLSRVFHPEPSSSVKNAGGKKAGRMTSEEAGKWLRTLQEDVIVHPNLKDTMFYI